MAAARRRAAFLLIRGFERFSLYDVRRAAMSNGDKQIALSGIVYWYGTHERISGAVIKATPREGKVMLTDADDDGDFKLHNLEPGTWTIVAMHEEGQPGRPQVKEPQEDETGLRFELFRQMGTADEGAGRRFGRTGHCIRGAPHALP